MTGAAERIVREATSWPGVHAERRSRGELSLRLGRRELGHLHGTRAAHFGFPRAVWNEQRAQGRIGPATGVPRGGRGEADRDGRGRA